MAKRIKEQLDMTDCCRRCKFNTGENEQFKHMFSCFFLSYCHNSYNGCEAERVGKGYFKPKYL